MLTGPTDKTDDWIKATLAKNAFRKFVDPKTHKETGDWLTAPARLSFPHLFKPQKAMEDGQQDKYTATFLFPRGADLTAFRQELNKTGQAKWGELFAEYAANPNFNKPVKDQKEKSRYEGYLEGCLVFTASGTRKPMVVDPRGVPITDESKVYPGAWVIGLVRPFAFEARNAKGVVVKRGVSVGLQQVCVIADDKELGGGSVDPVAAFAGVTVEGESYDPDAAFHGAGAPVEDYSSIL